MQFVDVHDTRIPALGFGTWLMEGEECRRGVEHALAIGYRHIDTAQIYENERQVGRAIADSKTSRDDIFLTTKVWRSNLAEQAVAPSVEESLRRLGTDYVDLLLIHWPSEQVPHEETLEAMERLKQQGKVRHIGVSNFPPSQLEAALDCADVMCNQVEYHPFLAQPALLEIAEDRDLMLTAYSPLARGRVLDDDTLADIGAEHGKTPAQIALRWLIEQPNVSAIPKAASAKHREENFAIFDFELTDEQNQRIDDLAEGQRLLDPEFAPQWER